MQGNQNTNKGISTLHAIWFKVTELKHYKYIFWRPNKITYSYARTESNNADMITLTIQFIPYFQKNSFKTLIVL